jgi:hypothetical protein
MRRLLLVGILALAACAEPGQPGTATPAPRFGRLYPSSAERAAAATACEKFGGVSVVEGCFPSGKHKTCYCNDGAEFQNTAKSCDGLCATHGGLKIVGGSPEWIEGTATCGDGSVMWLDLTACSGVQP